MQRAYFASSYSHTTHDLMKLILFRKKACILHAFLRYADRIGCWLVNVCVLKCVLAYFIYFGYCCCCCYVNIFVFNSLFSSRTESLVIVELFLLCYLFYLFCLQLFYPLLLLLLDDCNLFRAINMYLTWIELFSADWTFLFISKYLCLQLEKYL